MAGESADVVKCLYDQSEYLHGKRFIEHLGTTKIHEVVAVVEKNTIVRARLSVPMSDFMSHYQQGDDESRKVFVDYFVDTPSRTLLRLKTWLLRREFADGSMEWKLRAFVTERDQNCLRWVEFIGLEDIVRALVFFGDTLQEKGHPRLFPNTMTGNDLQALAEACYLVVPTARVHLPESLIVLDAVGWVSPTHGAGALCTFDALNNSESARARALAVDSSEAPSKVSNRFHCCS